ncbi:hypothetical protein AVEN_201172-1 [Araneus ventricosus]|uniref:Uncharacterized protein n=1 Tax=Araneus ventricosus TaxID=182803 RepID=A0A4Y2KDZ7_ARAVE|nr:hypothetical protein AVEN_201172-1 [Araneus ventricosus]
MKTLRLEILEAHHSLSHHSTQISWRHPTPFHLSAHPYRRFVPVEDRLLAHQPVSELIVTDFLTKRVKPAIHLYSTSSIWTKAVICPPIQVEKSGTSIHLKSQIALAVGESDLLPPSTADLRSPYSFLHSADFRFATLVAVCRSIQSFDVLTKKICARTAGVWFGWKSDFSQPLCYVP